MPGGEQGDLGVAQAAVVEEGRVVPVGVPRGHGAFAGDLGELPGALFRICVGEQGKGGDLPGPVADGAVLVEQRGDVLGVGGRGGGRFAGQGGGGEKGQEAGFHRLGDAAAGGLVSGRAGM
jgi:hypothetical protein